MTRPVGEQTDLGDMHEASSNVEQTRYPVMTRHVFIPLKIAWIPSSDTNKTWDFPMSVEPNNG